MALLVRIVAAGGLGEELVTMVTNQATNWLLW